MRRRLLTGLLLLGMVVGSRHLPVRIEIDHEGYWRDPSLLTWLVEQLAPWMEGAYRASTIKSIQKISQAVTAAAVAKTITSVSTTATILYLNGFTATTAGLVDPEDSFYSTVLTNATTVTFNTDYTDVNATNYATVVEYYPSVFTVNGVQRGTISLNALTTATATITSTGTKAHIASCGSVFAFVAGNTLPKAGTSLVLTNATTVTATRTTAVTQMADICYQVPDWK